MSNFVLNSKLFLPLKSLFVYLHLNLVSPAVPEVGRSTGKYPNAPYGQPILGAETYVMSSIIHKWQW